MQKENNKAETIRSIKLDARLQAAERADKLRTRFNEAGTFVLNLISAPGSGKTELVAKTSARLKDKIKIASIAGDVQTSLDAERIATSGVTSLAIETHGSCHLRSEDVIAKLDELKEMPELLFIENVGNLVCPSSTDLGQDHMVALVSLPEGDDKPIKYPSIFRKSGAFVISKMDMKEVCGSDIERMRSDVKTLNSDIRIFELSAKTEEGLKEWCDWLQSSVEAKRK